MYLLSSHYRQNSNIPIVKSRRASLCVILLILLLFLTFVNVCQGDTLRVGVSMHPLYQFVDARGRFSGIDVELSEAVFAHAGFEVEFIPYPWKRIVYLIEQGDLDAALSAADSDKNSHFAYFSSEHLRIEHTAIYSLKENTSKFYSVSKLTHLRDLDIKLGVVRGVSYSSEYEQLLQHPWFSRNLVIVDSYEPLIDLLIKQRIDAYLGSELAQASQIRKRQLQTNIQPVLYLTSEKEALTHIMYSKKTVPKEWAERINVSMRELKASETFQQIWNKYYLQF